MNLKEIIIEGLIFGFKQNKPKWWDYEAYLRFIEPIIRGAVRSATGNITTTGDWQVIASGEVKKDDEQYLWLGNMWSNELEIKISSFIFKKSNYGKNIEIAVREVKERNATK